MCWYIHVDILSSISDSRWNIETFSFSVKLALVFHLHFLMAALFIIAAAFFQLHFFSSSSLSQVELPGFSPPLPWWSCLVLRCFCCSANRSGTTKIHPSFPHFLVTTRSLLSFCCSCFVFVLFFYSFLHSIPYPKLLPIGSIIGFSVLNESQLWSRSSFLYLYLSWNWKSTHQRLGRVWWSIDEW